MSNKVFRIKNRYLFGLVTWLNNLELAGKESRERTRFLQVCLPRVQEIDSERQKMLKKYARKDKEGNPKIKKKDGQDVYDITDEDFEKYKEELGKYLNEEFVIDILEGNKAKVKTTKELVLNTDEKFSGTDANIYDEWCKAFEKIDV